MLKGNIRKNFISSFKNKFNNTFGFLGVNTWVFTVLFFGGVLIASVWIWWQCSYQPKPSDSVMKKIETEKEDFDNMKKETLEAITFLQERRENYNNSDKFGNQRELFVDLLDENVVERLKESENAETTKEVESNNVNSEKDSATMETQVQRNFEDDESGSFEEKAENLPFDN